jgi:hypothetical protein
MLLHPPGNNFHLRLHVRNTPELTTCGFPVHHAVQVPVNGTGFTERYERFPDCPDLLDPCPLARRSCTLSAFTFSGAFAVPVRPLGGSYACPAAAYTLLLVRLDCTIGDEIAEIIP